MSQQHAGQFLHGFQPLPAQLVDPFLQIIQHGSFVAVIPQMREALLQQVGFENAPVQSKQGVQLAPLAAIQIEPTAQKQPTLASYQIPRGSSFAEELCPPHFVHRLAGMLQNMKLVVDYPSPGLVETAPPCPPPPPESPFVETPSDVSPRTRPASVSSAPPRTTAVPLSPDCSPPSETFASSPDRSHRLPSGVTPASFALPTSDSDTARRWHAPCCWPSQTVAPLVAPPRSHRPTPPPLRSAC